MLGLLAFGVQLVALTLLFLNSRTALRALRLSLRRETVAVTALAVYDELLRRSVAGTLDEEELRLGLTLVGVGWADELHAQQGVTWRTRIPRVGSDWPDAQLATVLGEVEAEA